MNDASDAQSMHGVVINHHSANCIPVENKRDAKENSACESKLLYKWKTELFSVFTPFYMDSQALRIEKHHKISTGADTNIEALKETSADKKRKKKRKLSQNEVESKFSIDLKTALPGLVAQAKKDKILSETSQDLIETSDNNREARQAAAAPGCGDIFIDLCEDSKPVLCDSERNLHLEINHSLTFSPSFIIHKCVHNESDTGLCLTLDKHQFLIPPNSRFLTSNLSQFLSHLHESIKVDDGYDVIVIDPPWTNKSVKRKKSYQSILETDLCALPVQDLSKPGSLIIVWVTNNLRINDFIKENLFPCWGVSHVADWTWMKVTIAGEPILDIDSRHKKPYEKVIIGKVLPLVRPDAGKDKLYSAAENHVTKCLSASGNEHSSSGSGLTADVDSLECKQPTLPKEYILLSVPCSLHSKKPPLKDVLKPYLPPNPKCLELFARNLMPGWTSWGNEPLRHQHLDFFEECFDQESRSMK